MIRSSMAMAQSLARPGANVTGVYTMTEEMNPKRLALLKEAVPKIQRVGVLTRSDFQSLSIAKHDWQNAEWADHQLGVELIATASTSNNWSYRNGKWGWLS
jgi:putative ABC transport system substrate-binding protein